MLNQNNAQAFFLVVFFGAVLFFGMIKQENKKLSSDQIEINYARNLVEKKDFELGSIEYEIKHFQKMPTYWLSTADTNFMDARVMLREQARDADFYVDLKLKDLRDDELKVVFAQEIEKNEKKKIAKEKELEKAKLELAKLLQKKGEK